MRILIALAILSLFAPATIAQIYIPDCADYGGAPIPVSSIQPESYLRQLVAVAGGFCGVEGYYGLRFWSVGPDGVPSPGGLMDIVHGQSPRQVAAHADRLYAAYTGMGIMVHEIAGATPVVVDSILATRSSCLVAAAGDRLLASRGTDRLLFFDLAGPSPVLVDSLDLAGLVLGGARGAGDLALVQTDSPPRVHVIDPAAAAILGSVDLPWNTRLVSWDGRLGVLRRDGDEDTVLLDASVAAAPVLQPLPELADTWFVGGAMVEGLLWLSGCGFDDGGFLARYDVTDPANPVFLSTQLWYDTMTESVVAGGAVHTLTEPISMCTPGTWALESMLVGTADPVPEAIGYLHDTDLDNADHADLDGRLLCRTDGDRLSIVDFADITAPVLRSEIELPEQVTSPHIVAGDSRVVVFGSGTGVAAVGGRIFVYDIDDPDAPVHRSTRVCYRFHGSAYEGDRLYTFGVDDDLYVWEMTAGGSVSLLIEHTSLTYDTYTSMLAHGDLLFAIVDYHWLDVWDFGDPFAPVAVTGIPAGEVSNYGRLARWNGGVYWSGFTGLDRYGFELLPIDDGVPGTPRLVWEYDTDAMFIPFSDGVIDAGDRLYLGGPGVLAVDIVSEPPVVVGMIPSFPGRLHLIDGHPVAEGYRSFWTWAPACGDILTAPGGPPPAPPALEAWPNPFNPRLTVSFTLPEPGPARVAVYDLRGRRLRTLMNGHRDAGRHALQWNGRDEAGRTMAAGVYVVRLEQEGRTAARRVTLVK